MDLVIDVCAYIACLMVFIIGLQAGYELLNDWFIWWEKD
jgi:uncharacterized membrane protein (DUF4010 family)